MIVQAMAVQAPLSWAKDVFQRFGKRLCGKISECSPGSGKAIEAANLVTQAAGSIEKPKSPQRGMVIALVDSWMDWTMHLALPKGLRAVSRRLLKVQAREP